MSKRTKTLGLHEWSKDDTILTLYYTKYGTYGLYLKSESDIAKFIGTSVSSLKMQSGNMRALMGENQMSLSDYSKLQEDVYNEYDRISKISLMRKVKKIINQDTHERNEILRKMGKDPKKMVRV